jgi:hypothetical protein
MERRSVRKDGIASSLEKGGEKGRILNASI